MISTIAFNNENYPLFQSEGFAAQFAFPFADKVCHGVGVDVGYGKEEWKYPKATYGVDISIPPYYSATNYPYTNLNFVFSSHCLEHLNDWVDVLGYWSKSLNPDTGVLFLYLPHYAQTYWRPWNNRKHVNILKSEEIKECLIDKYNYKQVFTSEGYDLNHSFYVVASF